jgi:nucleotide-binding universal stress UspA family protein
VLDRAATLAEALHGSLILVRAEDEPAAIGAALDYLPRAQALVSAQHPTLTVDTDVRIGEAVYGIAEAVVQNQAALVVMATHGRGGARRAIFGSVAGEVLKQSDVPLVLLRPAAVEADESEPTVASVR